MVSLIANNSAERTNRLNQSVDLALQKLLEEQTDPLSLAFYLWVLSNNHHSLINLKNLTNWGLGWIRRIFIEHKVSRRRDEEIASAALILISLMGSSKFEEMKNELKNGFEEFLNTEMTRHSIPLKHSAYGVIFLLAARLLGYQSLSISEASVLAGCSFVEAISSGRLLGLNFAIWLLKLENNKECLEKIENKITENLNETDIDFEDQAYLLQALWYIRNSEGNTDQELIRLSEHLLDKTPIWQYFMNGLEDLAPAGDGQTIIYISHFYRGALLDILLQYQSKELEFKEQQIDKKYQGRAGVSWSAFGFYLIVFIILWILTGYFMIPPIDEARRYWIVGDFKAMKSSSAIFYLIGVLWTAYLGILTYQIIPSVYSIFIKNKIASDERIKNILLAKAWLGTKIWLVTILFALIFGVLTNLVAPTAQHLFKKEAWSPSENQ